MDLSKKLDIFLITYNRAKNLDETLSQLYAENSPIKHLTLTVIDNCSTDETSEVVRKYQKDFPNINYTKNKYNIGGNANIMKAFYSAEKEYVWVLADNDFYNWDSWSEVEQAISDKKDAIMVATYEVPTYDIAQFYIQTTFVPGVIYRKDLIDDEVMVNMAYNISNMFPHLAISSKVINEKKDTYIVDKAIIDVGENEDYKDKKTGKFSYSRGYKKSGIHPTMRDLNWMAGFANSINLITDKKTRNYIASHNLFYMAKFNTAEVFFLNSKLSDGSIYNLISIFSVLDLFNKLRFLVNWILYLTIFRILYIYSGYLRPDKNGCVYKQYRARILNLIKTKLFKVKVKISKGVQ